MRETFADSGPLSSVDVLAALGAVGRGGASGTFRATGPRGEEIRFGFDAGILVALDPPPEISPAEVLIRAGKVQRVAYEALTVGDFEDRFAVAAASGVISRRETNWGLKISAIESLSRVLSWGEGAYAFEEGRPEPTAPPLKLPIDQWILELFLRSNDRGFVVRKVGATDIPIARAPGFAESFAALGLTADADAVVEGVDGRRTVEQVVRRSRAEEFATLKLLAALIVLGLIRPIHEIPPAAEPKPPAEIAPEPAEAAPALPEEGAPEGVAPEPPEEIPEPEWDLDEGAAAPAAGIPPEENAEEDIAFGESSAPPLRAAGSGEEESGREPRFELAPIEPRPEEMPSEGAALPEVSVPLFALTAPEPESGRDFDEAAEEPAAAAEGSTPHRRLGTLRAAALFAVLAALVAVWLVRRRPVPTAAGNPPAAPGPPAPASPPPAKEAPRAETPPPPSAAESRKPEIPAPRTKPAPPPAAGPAVSPKAVRPASPAPAPRAERPAASRWEEIARAGRKTFEHPGPHRYAIQLELACEEATLRKAFEADPQRRRIWLAPYEFRGRSCYRVLWGKYRDLASAKAAKSTVPAMFSLEGNRPAVVSLGRAK